MYQTLLLSVKAGPMAFNQKKKNIAGGSGLVSSVLPLAVAATICSEFFRVHVADVAVTATSLAIFTIVATLLSDSMCPCA
jgi:TPP-dependent pyruvate/acetoin dehydrogenase alpha subunit